ncbi:MAG: hypothetical protein KDB00_20910, partial [Planctomycetales bacterium]|nr:hypothetical protein [Planctomycetales bacterium]
RFDWMMDIAVAPGENAATQRTYFIVAGTLGTESESFRAVLDRIKLVMPRSDFRERFRATFQLFRGKSPESFDVETDFKRLYDALADHEPTRLTPSNLFSPPNMFSPQEIAIDSEVIEMFIRQGQVELARDGLALLVNQGDVDALLATAQTKMDEGDAETAEQAWRQAALKAIAFNPAAAGAVLDHGLAYAKTVAGQWLLAKRSGHRELADQLEQRIRMMLTSPSLSFRQEFAEHLLQIGQHEIAIEVLKDLVVLASFGGDDAPDFFKVAVSYVSALDNFKESNPDGLAELNLPDGESVRWSDVAIFGILKSDVYYDTAYISVPLSIRKAFLQHAIDTGNEALARQTIDQIRSIDPLNIDFGERMLPEMRKAGMESLADSALDTLIENGLRHVARFKSDATALNNLAWTAAMNGRRLDEALELSERAVFYEPESVTFRDTLAEVLHLLGRTDEALAIESACLLDEPDEWHLHEQIGKYRTLLEK